MKAARLVVLGVAVAAGGIAAYLAAGSKAPPAPPPAAPVVQLETTDVLVAKSELNRGQVIETSDIGWQTWPAAAANSNYIKKSDRPNAIADFTGAIVRVSLVAGDPIRDPNVVMAKASGFLAAVLPKAMRAVAIEISPEAGAGGFILPDDHVDVMLTRRDKAAEKASGVEKFVSDTILRNIRVLAVDQTLETKAGTKTQLGKTATLELTEDQAETLALSRQLGTLSLTLRSILDTSETSEDDTDKKDRRGPINMVRFGVTTPGNNR
ncbi:MAG: Flp pilus assembly protein CpaB [Xanthobacteraceae bacterium]